MDSLTGKAVLITGGSKGIGAATSLRLARLGASIAINYSSDSQAAESIVCKIKSSTKSDAIAIQANAGSIAGVQQMVDTTVKKFGKIDILIPCAGILMMKDLANTTEEDFDRSYALNVKGPYFLVQKAVPHMPQGGKIVLFSTSQCVLTTVTPAYLLYNSTKGAVEQMTRVMAKELAAKGININCVSPGPTATELFLKGKSEELIKNVGKMSPYGRIGEPEEIADAVSFLVGVQSQWTSGQTLRVNGGAS